MASSTALSCLRSSSLRDKVLALLVLVVEAEAAASAGAFPGMLVTLLELFGGGEAGRFLKEKKRKEKEIIIRKKPSQISIYLHPDVNNLRVHYNCTRPRQSFVS